MMVRENRRFCISLDSAYSGGAYNHTFSLNQKKSGADTIAHFGIQIDSHVNTAVYFLFDFIVVFKTNNNK